MSIARQRLCQHIPEATLSKIEGTQEYKGVRGNKREYNGVQLEASIIPVESSVGRR
jgi:hypothetical protein